MSASELVNVGSCSSDECSANAKATLFLASSKRHDSNSYGTQSLKSLVLENALLEAEGHQASRRVYPDRGVTCILDQNQPSGYDDMCLSPLAYEGRCRSLASFVVSSEARNTVNQVCDSNHGPTSWPLPHATTIQNILSNSWNVPSDPQAPNCF